MGAAGLSLIFSAGQVTAEKTGSGTLQRAVIKIDTLSCGGCYNTISEGLLPLKGYSGMGMNLLRKLIAVDFTEPLTVEEISQKLTQVGYPGTVETVEPVLEKESFAYLDQKRAGAGPGKGGCCNTSTNADNKGENKKSSGLKLQPAGSCCVIPKISQPTEE